MSDLFDDARPVRDATVAELERALAQGEELPAHLKDGHRLGCQMTALLMTFVMQRLKGAQGEVENDGLQDLLATAIAEPIAYICSSFRPVRGGHVLTPLETLNQFGTKIGAHAEHKVAMAQAGLQDFVVPFNYRDGKVERSADFDVMDMLNKGQGL